MFAPKCTFFGIAFILQQLLAAASFGEVLYESRFQSSDRLICMAIEVRERKVPFIFDTGAELTVFDQTMPVGRLNQKGSIQTSTGQFTPDIRFYESPEIRFGLVQRTPIAVSVSDLSLFSNINGSDVKGFLGMDVLRHYVVEINPDDGILRVYDKLPEIKLGKRTVLRWKRLAPYVKLTLSNGRDVEFLVDTGFSTGDSGSLESSLADVLVQTGHARLAANARTTTVDATGKLHKQEPVDVPSVSLAGYMIPNTRWQRSGRNILGLGALCRFNVVFDFPQSAIYLSPSSRFDAPETFNRSGLHGLRRRPNEVVIDAVDPDSPAMKAGVRVGDILKRVKNEKTTETTLRRMYQMFGVPKGPVTVFVERDSQETEFVLDWTDPPPMPPPPPSKKKMLDPDED